MKKVVIIGSPGAGKSTFATKLAKQSGLPLIHLDYYYHDTSHDYEHDKEAWRRRVKELIKGKEWITDGNYCSTYDIRLPAADTIIFLNIPKRIVLWRIMKRRITYHKRTRPDMPSDWEEKADWEFLKYVWGFKKSYSSDIKMTLENYKDKDVFIVNSPNEAKILFKQLSRP